MNFSSAELCGREPAVAGGHRNVPAAGDGQRRHAGRIPGASGGAGAHPPAAHGAQLRHDESRLSCLDLHDGGPPAILGRRRRRRSRLPREAPGSFPIFFQIFFF